MFNSHILLFLSCGRKWHGRYGFKVASNLNPVSSPDLVVIRGAQGLCQLLDSNFVDWWFHAFFLLSMFTASYHLRIVLEQDLKPKLYVGKRDKSEKWGVSISLSAISRLNIQDKVKQTSVFHTFNNKVEICYNCWIQNLLNFFSLLTCILHYCPGIMNLFEPLWPMAKAIFNLMWILILIKRSSLMLFPAIFCN